MMTLSVILSKIKAYWSIFAGLLVGGLTIAVKKLLEKNSELKDDLEESEAHREHDRVVAVKRKETAKQFNSRRAEAKSEIEETGVSKELSDPNKW